MEVIGGLQMDFLEDLVVDLAPIMVKAQLQLNLLNQAIVVLMDLEMLVVKDNLLQVVEEVEVVLVPLVTQLVLVTQEIEKEMVV